MFFNSALAHLCEFIEDCEFNKLAVRILHLIGTQGPTAATPSKYIRYIYNRVILENSTVRAAAVSSLAKFAAALPDLRPRITVLLNRCLDDTDDEVRDRAAMYLRVIADPALSAVYVSPDGVAWAVLEGLILNYLSSNDHSAAFSLDGVPVVTREDEENERLRVKAAEVEPAASPVVDKQAEIAVQMASIPQLALLGRLLKSSQPVALTESETEYVVTCTKHIFPAHVCFQFNVVNTLQECVLERVGVAMLGEKDCGLKQIMALTVPSLPYNSPANVWVVWEGTGAGVFGNVLKFLVKEIDPATGMPEEDGYDDEYAVCEVSKTA